MKSEKLQFLASSQMNVKQLRLEKKLNRNFVMMLQTFLSQNQKQL